MAKLLKITMKNRHHQDANLLISLAFRKMARPERFERPTLRFVVLVKVFVFQVVTTL